jgi:hypothetical protein
VAAMPVQNKILTAKARRTQRSHFLKTEKSLCDLSGFAVNLILRERKFCENANEIKGTRDQFHLCWTALRGGIHFATNDFNERQEMKR